MMIDTTINGLPIDRDADLLEALRVGGPAAAERLVSMFGDRAYRLAIGITGNSQDAEEAVQDAFWNVIRRIDTFRGDAALGSWIHRITANAAYHKCRSRSRRRQEISLDEILSTFHEDGSHADRIVDWSTELGDPAMQMELRSILTSALDELPDHYRAVIILHDIEALSMAEVAVSLGITVPTANARAHRAPSFCATVSENSCPAHRLASRWPLKADETLQKEAAMTHVAANPGGVPIEVFDGIRTKVLADRSQFFKDLAVPFYDANRSASQMSQASASRSGSRPCRPGSRTSSTASECSRRAIRRTTCDG